MVMDDARSQWTSTYFRQFNEHDDHGDSGGRGRGGKKIVDIIFNALTEAQDSYLSASAEQAASGPAIVCVSSILIHHLLE